jgi:hypothetical protein
MSLLRWREFLTAALFAIFQFSDVRAGALPEAGCGRQTISTLVSSDDNWTATIEEDLCSHGPSFTTVVLDRVRLIRRGERARDDGEVLILEEGGRPENRPLVQWLSPYQLQITVPNRMFLNLRKNSYDGVEVIVKFSPNDPSERKQFLKERGLPPD